MNEVDRIIADHELMMRDVREGCLDGLFIIGVFALFMFGAWMFA